MLADGLRHPVRKFQALANGVIKKSPFRICSVNRYSPIDPVMQFDVGTESWFMR